MRSVDDFETYDECVMKQLSDALNLSAECNLNLNCGSFQEFVVSLAAVSGSKKFIFHFDDVGVYELYGDEVAKNMIYRIMVVWRFTQKVAALFYNIWSLQIFTYYRREHSYRI